MPSNILEVPTAYALGGHLYLAREVGGRGRPGFRLMKHIERWWICYCFFTKRQGTSGFLIYWYSTNVFFLQYVFVRVHIFYFENTAKIDLESLLFSVT